MEVFDPEKQQLCGYLYKNEQNIFIYCCAQCEVQFKLGTELEAHSFIHFAIKDENYAEWCDQETPCDSSDCDLLSLGGTKNPPTEIDSDKFVHVIVPSSMDEAEFNSNPCRPTLKAMQVISEQEEPSNYHSTILPPLDAKQRKKKTFKNKKKSKSKSKEKPFQPATSLSCDICSTNFTYKRNLLQHMRRHIGNRLQPPCTICQKKVKNYEKHMRMNHLDERPYKCDYCTADFKQNSNRLIHMRSHTGEKPFICSRCGMAFSSLNSMQKHENKLHLNLKPHKCDLCEKSYHVPNMLKDHVIAQHTNEKPYVCKLCSNRFATRKYLRQHMLKHGEKRFQCKYCEIKFATTSGRRGHERQVHSAV